MNRRSGRFRTPRRPRGGCKIIGALQSFYHVANIGDAQLSAEDQFTTGVSDGYVRLSVGIEHVDDIIEDLAQALAA